MGHIEDQVVGRRAERRPRHDVGKVDAQLGPVAHAVREDAQQPRDLVGREGHGIVGETHRLELALHVVERERAAGDNARERVRRIEGGALGIGLAAEDLRFGDKGRRVG